MLRDVLKNVRDGMLALVYPQACRLCGQPVDARSDGVVCADCWEDTSITRLFDDDVCLKCGSPLKGSAAAVKKLASTNGRLAFDGAGSVLGSVSYCNCASLPFRAARACGAYSGALEASVLFLKSNPYLCPRLREILFNTWLEHEDVLSCDLIVPVPLHPHRERQRGFNQARVIARIISKASGLPIEGGAVVRRKQTEAHRAGMDAIDRARSVERAFSIKAPDRIIGTSVLLVDDVYTTGSTISAISKVMLEAGASRVNVLTIARATGF